MPRWPCSYSHSAARKSAPVRYAGLLRVARRVETFDLTADLCAVSLTRFRMPSHYHATTHPSTEIVLRCVDTAATPCFHLPHAVTRPNRVLARTDNH